MNTKIKKLISGFLIIAEFVFILSAYNLAIAQTVTPTPATPCRLSYSSTTSGGVSGIRQIICTVNDKVLTFSAADNTIYTGVPHSQYSQVWKLNYKQTPNENSFLFEYKYVLFTNTNSEGTAQPKIIGMANMIDFCQESGSFRPISGITLRGLNSSNSSCYSYPIYQFPTMLSYYQTTHTGYNPTPEDNAIYEALRSLYSRITPSGLGVDTTQTNVAPNAATLAACGAGEGNTVIPPISIDQTKFQVVLNEAKTDIIEQINSSATLEANRGFMVDAVNNILGIAWKEKYINSDTDKDLYRKFYNTGTEGSYPNVPLDNNTYTRFQELVAAQGADAANIGFVQWLGASKNWINVMNANDAKAMVEKEIPVIAAYYYLMNNIAFVKCAIAKNPSDPFAQRYASEIAAFEQKVQALRDSTIDTLNGFASNAGKTACDDITGGGYIMGMIGQAYCGLVLNLKQWADTFYCWSLGLFQSSVGVSTNEASNPTGLNKSSVCNSTTKAGVDALNNSSEQTTSPVE